METKLLSGIVQSGGDNTAKPLGKVPVTVYEATAQQPTIVGTTTTREDGGFDLEMELDKSDRIFYAVATVNQDVQLVTIIGSALQYDRPAWITASPTDFASDSAAEAGEYVPGDIAYIIINELTTVAAAFSMAQFIRDGVIGGDAFGLQIASLMTDNLVQKNSGTPSEVLMSPPNGDETNTLRSTRSLANLIAACINNGPDAAKSLFKFTTPPHGGAAPTNTFEALFNIARYPAHNVSCVYLESQNADTYWPALQAMPDAWTLAIKVNDTGSKDFLFGGPANVAFDKRGYGWIANNVVQGTPNSGEFAVVLKPNGKPADGSPTTPSEPAEGLPKSPLFGGGLLGGGFGVVVDRNQNVWLSNFGWGTGDAIPAKGSASLFNSEGKSISPSEGYVGGTWRVQDIVVDQDNNLWLASNNNALVVVFPNTQLHGDIWGPDPNRAVSAPIDDDFGPFGIAIAKDGSAWVTSSAGLWAYTESNLSRFRYENGQLTKVYCRKFGRGMKGLAIDSMGNIWVPSGGDDVVYLLNSEGEHISRFKGGGINGPWAVAIDGNDNVWVANFGKMLPCADYTHAAVSVLAGANAETRPEGFEIGEAISPPTGYTLPTAGAQVRLRTGEPLYGDGKEPCYSPLMRMTNVSIDQAGNVWAINNWKPNFNTDASAKTGNPGGDGIVIFVGLAKPPKKA
jgi:sugar lactone lactonase YvrE